MATKPTDAEAAWISEFGLSRGPGRNVRHIRTDGTLFNKGSPVTHVFLILKGQVKVVSTSQRGKIALYETIGKNGWIAEEAMDGLNFHAHSAIATMETEVLAFELEPFHQMLNDHPPLRSFFLRGIASHLRKRGKALDDMLLSPAPVRFGNVLKGLIEGHEADVIELRTTQDHLAAMAGTSRQTINQMMTTTFMSAGIITKEPGKRYRLHKGPLLKFLKGEEP